MTLSSPSSATASVLLVSHEEAEALGPLTRALATAGVDAQVARPGPWLVDADGVIVLRSCGAQVAERAEALYELLPLEIRGGAVVNRPSAHQIANHLALTAEALGDAGLPHVAARPALDPDSAVEAARMTGFPVTVRPTHASLGLVAHCEDVDEVCRAAERLLPIAGAAGVVVQPTFPAPADVHVLVVDDEVAGASLASLPAGPSAVDTSVPVSVGSTLSDLARAAVRAVGGDAMSAHALVGPHGRVAVLDVAACPPLARFDAPAWARFASFVARRAATARPGAAVAA